MLNLFSNILDKAKSGANYLSSGQLGSDVFDATRNQDPTQNIQFKAVQGGANLYTGAKESLMGVEKKGMSEFDQKKEKARQFLSEKGYSPEVIDSTLSQIDYKPGFGTRLATGLGTRLGEVQSTTERLADTPIAKRMATGIPSYAGDVVGTAFEPVSAALSPVVQKVIEKTGQTENVQEIGQWWEGIRQSNPNFADAIEGSLNVASLAPIPKVGTLAKDLSKQAGKSIVKTAEQAVPKFAKKLTSQADMGFRKQAEDIALPKLSEMGMKDKQKVVGDVIETKSGLFKKEELIRSPQEALAIEEVSRMLKEGKIKKGSTELQKAGAIENEIGGLAEALKGRLDNTPNPVNIAKSEVDTLLDDITKNIDKNPFLKAGDLDRSAKQIIANVREKLTKGTYTPSELLEIRKQLDADIKQFKGEKVFSPDIENALSTTIKDFRQGLNNKVAELVPDVDVRAFLDRQSALYTALDHVNTKWTKQANSMVGRVINKIQSVTGIPRTEIIELSTALGLLGASSLAPIVAPIAIGATVIAGGKKAVGAILSPKNKVKLANMLTKIDDALKKNPKDPELLKAKELLSKPPKNGGTTPNILRSSDNRPKPKLIKGAIMQSAGNEIKK